MAALIIHKRGAKWRLGVFLFLCLILGGTSQDIIAVKLPLYIVSLVMIVLALTSKTRAPLAELYKMPELFLSLLILIYFLYLVPLPPGIWTELTGRATVEKGFASLGAQLPWLPLSLSPEKTLHSTFNFLPLVAISLIFRLQASSTEKANALLALTFMGVFSVIFGILQITGNEGLYIYEFTNKGRPVGFFSNANHQACFLAMILPLSLLLCFRPNIILPRGSAESNKFKIFGACAAIIIIIGILLTNSLAGYLFLFITLAPCLLVIFWRHKSSKYAIVCVVLIGVVFVFDFIFLGNHLGELVNEFSSESTVSRSEIFRNSLEAQKNYGFFGSGPGSFLDVYFQYENREIMTLSFAPQAHNDYLQFVLELGVGGMFFIGMCFGWSLKRIRKFFNSMHIRNRFQIVIALALSCPLIHSVIDYPMRTMAISVLFFILLLTLED